MNLTYRSFVDVDDLLVNECTIHGVQGTPDYWHMWFRVNRETDGQPEAFCVPVNPNGTFIEAGPGGKTWGLTRSSPNTWQISPSVNVLDTRDLHPGPHPSAGSLWHQTPAVVNVPEGERWQTGAP